MTSLLSPEITTVASLTERCDRCAAAAKLVVNLASGGELAFCGHHANRHHEDITRVAERIVLEEGFAWAGK
ncbi:DUF7455 domain-containing protein [Paractinoplanes rishiriensis]|jgi:hypothetical protein|uniref:DUF7455 domain-containing protein n=1 Tax=Paractinoplanes rishiriensis TaxID=1050105 RepID=A0A919K252_9ACTN|nr:hypothetical protein [Actinoplanes rishiriensis]GIE97847.1 hypothetical protein Ari01nite_53120 [Actinoplanes rishiriensis]